MGPLLRQLQTLYNIGTIGDLTDGQLLERFATDASEIAELAFAVLVERHQVMVWRGASPSCATNTWRRTRCRPRFSSWCARRDRSGCETRSALAPSGRVPNGVLPAATVKRRRRLEQRRAERSKAPWPRAKRRDRDHDAVVHEELNRLPEKYRAPVVLCDLEGRTHHEAARFLGCRSGPSRAVSRKAAG